MNVKPDCFLMMMSKFQVDVKGTGLRQLLLAGFVSWGIQ